MASLFTGSGRVAIKCPTTQSRETNAVDVERTLLRALFKRLRMRTSNSAAIPSSAIWRTTTETRTQTAPKGSVPAAFTFASPGLEITTGNSDGRRDRKRSEMIGTRRDQNWTLSERKWRRTLDELVSMSRKSEAVGVNRVQIGKGAKGVDADGPVASSGESERDPGFPDGEGLLFKGHK